MADFCNQCSESHFGLGFNDMKNLSTEEDAKNGLYAWALCECCGYTQVDHTGNCIHHKKEDEGHKYCHCGI